MSKKQIIKRKIPPNERVFNKPVQVPPQTRPALVPASNLILFDRKAQIFILGLLVLYLILSSLKIHTSSIGNWDTFFGAKESESVIAGQPRFIRMDEWMISTPALMGQHELGLPIKNQANGGANAPVVFGLPIKDISSALRPSVWSYFIFDVERAYAFSWNFNIFFFLISMFLLFMLLTRNNFWLSVFGAFFIFLTPAVQWWSYTISSYMIYLNGMIVTVAYLLYSKKLLPLIFSAAILIVCIFSFLSFLYPPFQVPLIYLYLAIFIGYLLRERRFEIMKDKLSLKLVIVGVAFLVLGSILFHYYQIAKDTFSVMMNTVYPGKRFSTGGDLLSGKVFADFFAIFMNDTHTPKLWLNICEASGAVMFFPILFYGLFYYYFKHKKIDSLLYSLSIFLIFTLVYVVVGFPAFLSKITLFSMSPAFRTLAIIGVGNCILLICYLSSTQIEVKQRRFPWIEFGIIAAATFVFMMVVSASINKATERFFSGGQVIIATVLTVLSYLLIRFKDFRFARPALYLILAILAIPHANVNPLTKGLGPVLDNPLTQTTKQLHDQDPDAGWALFGDIRLTHLIKSTGSNILNGVKYVPPLEIMKVLDPKGINDSVYNRYAWMTMRMYINWKDTVIFQKTFDDSYIVFMDPCSPKLKQLKVKYFVFDYFPKDQEVRCMTKVSEVAGLLIYKRKDE